MRPFRNLARVTAMAVAVMAAAPSHAMFDEFLDSHARDLIDEAVLGNPDEAFAAADKMRLASDTALAERLATEKAAFAEKRAKFTDPGRAFLMEDSHFGACIHRTYAVRFAEGKQLWRLSYKKGVGGWHLSELTVVDQA